MNEPVSLEEARWAKDNNVRAHNVAACLRVALAQIERGEIEADHVVVCFGVSNEETGSITTDWLQAGKFSGFAQLGLLERIKMAIVQHAEVE